MTRELTSKEIRLPFFIMAKPVFYGSILSLCSFKLDDVIIPDEGQIYNYNHKGQRQKINKKYSHAEHDRVWLILDLTMMHIRYTLTYTENNMI